MEHLIFLGELLAILAGLTFAMRDIAAKRVMGGLPSLLASFLITLTSIPLLLLFSWLNGDLSAPMPGWEPTLLIMGAGILRFVLGRTSLMHSIKRVGAARATTLAGTQALFSAFWGLVLLKEDITLPLILGIGLLLLGVMLIGQSGAPSSPKGSPWGGFITGLLAGMSFGTTPLLVKLAVLEFPSPIFANMLSHIPAALGQGALLLPSRSYSSLKGLGAVKLGLFALVSLLAAAATTLTFVAVSLAPIASAYPLVSTAPLFSILITAGFMRRAEAINLKLVVAAVATVLGAGLILGF